MKSFLRICCVMLLSVLMFSCEKDIEPSIFAPAMETGQAVEVYRKGATLYGNIQNPAGYKVESFGIELATFSRPGMTIEQYFATAQRFVVDSADAQGNFSVQVSGLEPGGTYLYRSFVNSGHNDVYAADSTFKTPENTAPVFGNIKVTNVSYTGFDISVELLDNGGKEMETMAYLYKEMPEESQEDLTTRTPDIVTLYVNNLTEENTYTASIKNLYAGRRYAIRPYGVAFTTGYGKTQYVQTQVSDATLVSACDTSDASYNSLHLKASILAENKQYPVTEVGFCYSSESSEPTVAHLTLPATLTGTDFEATLTQLLSEKTYYIRAYARQSDDAYIYGEVLEYTPSDVFYTLTFDANGGNGEMPSQMYFPEVQQEISANTFTRDGYTFAGWNTSPDGSGTVYTDQQEITLTQDITLYAQWQEKAIKGTENGYEWVDLGLPSGLKWATCNVGATTPEGYGDYFAWGETSPKDNYDWSTYKYCEGSGTTLTKYNTSSSYGTVDNKTTLELTDDAARVNWGGSWRMPTYAEHEELVDNCTWTWTTQNGVSGYRVTCKTNGNSIFLPAAGYRNGTSVDDVGSYGSYWSSSLNESYPYSEYNLRFYSGGVDWGSRYRNDGLTVRAVFTENDTPSTFVTLSFNANGGTGTMAAQTFEAGVSQTIAANTFTRDGYTFTGWNTSPDGSGTAYTDQQEVTLSEDLTLYAQWKCTLSFNANGGTGTMAAQTFEAGVSQAIAANTFTRDGYEFTGWNTSPDGSGTNYADQQEITLSEDLTLYAQWKQEQVVSGSENGYDYVDLGLPSGLKWATCNIGATTPEGYGDYFAWGETEPKTNYDWSTYKYCNGSVNYMTKYCTSSYSGRVDNKTTLDLSDDAARTNWGGKWRMPTRAEQDELRNNCTWSSVTRNGVNGYKVTSETNGNSIFLPAAGIRLGTSVSNVGSYGHYWSSSLQEGDPCDAYYLYFYSGYVDWRINYRYSGRTVRAVFSDKQYTLSFNANGGTGTMAAQPFEAGLSQAITANAFTRDGYTFTAWNTSPDGSGTAYTDQQEITLSEDLTLYAQWQEQVVPGSENGHEWVDLGLPSGLKWATCNVGATTPEGYGDYFAWGETSPKDNYDWSTYKYCEGTYNTMTKYCTDSYYGTVDNKTTLELTDDAARVNWGGSWRMPTLAEQEELVDNCTWIWTKKNGIKGYKVTSKTNGNSIFLPAAGGRYGASVSDVGSYGFYWSSSLQEVDPSYYAYFLYFYSGTTVRWQSYYRYNGRTVRAVCP